MLFDLLVGNGLLDLLHDGVNLSGASGVDGPALLLTSHAANVGGDVIEDRGEGDIDNVSLAEGGGDGELLLIELVQGLGVEGADEELGALIDILLGLLKEDSVEVTGGVSLTLSVSVSVSTAAGSESESVTSSDVAGDGTLGSSVDESLADEDLGADDDGGGGQELGVDDGHGANEAKSDNDGLHFAVS